MALVGTSAGLLVAWLNVRLPGAVSASSTVKLKGPVEVYSLIVWLAMPVITGGVFRALTVKSNLALALLTPSLTKTVIVATPGGFVAAVTVTVRLLPLPPNTILL